MAQPNPQDQTGSAAPGAGTPARLREAIASRGLPAEPESWLWDPRPTREPGPRVAGSGKGSCPFLQDGVRFFEGHAFWSGAQGRQHHLVVVADGEGLRWAWMS